ncbi:GNAT family N-acetyltransferase [Algibacter sp. L1A34]|uniref:GNAT family N-acetyltransferase n=1 Tax=Algibacter sp. L1A34 TaxID=2686365 RepID=UPI00131AE0A8|nr:GNAT family protein [Algibacter sp. L1A34]
MNTLILENNRVKLSLLTLDNYFEILKIGQQKNLVQYSPSKVATPEDLKNYVQTAVKGYQNKTVIPFLIFDKKTNAYAGTTRFANIDSHNKLLHIGWTWIGHEFQGTGLNINMKFLMLQYAFQVLKFDKVEFRADERNIASRKAIEKIGGKLEGILRKDMLMLDGFKRNSCCYGILKKEWPAIKTSVFKDF